MDKLRAVVLSAFVLSIVITVLSFLLLHNMTLHIIHIVLITLTFLLIALYLNQSASIASMTVYRELCLRLEVDPGVEFIKHLPVGAPIFNVCAGVLAKRGIYVRSADSMRTLAKLTAVAAAGNSESRDGYDITKKTLADMGVELSDDINACPVKLILGPFDLADSSGFDFVLTQNKVAHILAAVYLSRLFVRFTRLSRVLLICALAVTAALTAFGLFTYAAASIALWSASEVIFVHRITRRTVRLTFKSVSGKY